MTGLTLHVLCISHLTFCHPVKFFMLFCHLPIFFQNKLFQKNLLGIPSQCQKNWIQIRPDILLGLICVKLVCKRYEQMIVCLFDLILYVPSTIFHLYRDESSWVEPVLSLNKCVLLKDHSAVTPVRLEPAALRSRVKHSTTELPMSR